MIWLINQIQTTWYNRSLFCETWGSDGGGGGSGSGSGTAAAAAAAAEESGIPGMLHCVAG